MPNSYTLSWMPFPLYLWGFHFLILHCVVHLFNYFFVGKTLFLQPRWFNPCAPHPFPRSTNSKIKCKTTTIKKNILQGPTGRQFTRHYPTHKWLSGIPPPFPFLLILCLSFCPATSGHLELTDKRRRGRTVCIAIVRSTWPRWVAIRGVQGHTHIWEQLFSRSQW